MVRACAAGIRSKTKVSARSFKRSETVFVGTAKGLRSAKMICLAGAIDDVAWLFGDRLPAVYEVVT